MQLRERNEIAESFVFALGQLHITFATLKVIGRYIGCSGIYRLYIEVGLYGHTAIGQIIDDKHTKRCIEAFMTMYLALFSIFLHEDL